MLTRSATVAFSFSLTPASLEDFSYFQAQENGVKLV